MSRIMKRVSEAILIPLLIGIVSPFILSYAHAEIDASYLRLDHPSIALLLLLLAGWLILIAGFVLLGRLTRLTDPTGTDVISLIIGFIATIGIAVFLFLRFYFGHSTGIEENLIGLLPATGLIYLIFIVWRVVSLTKIKKHGNDQHDI